MKPTLSIDECRIPRCSCCKSYDGLGRADTDEDTGAWWWWCRSCDPRLAPPREIPGQGELDYDGAEGALHWMSLDGDVVDRLCGAFSASSPMDWTDLDGGSAEAHKRAGGGN